MILKYKISGIEYAESLNVLEVISIAGDSVLFLHLFGLCQGSMALNLNFE